MSFIENIFTHVFIDESAPSCSNSCPYCCLKQQKKVFCEANIDGLIAQPANAFSSLAFCFIGLVIFYQIRNSKRNLGMLFGIIAILIGLFSFLNHATFTFFGQTLDLFSMYLMSSLLIILNLKRFFFYLSNRFLVLSYFFLVSVPILLMIFFRGLSVGSLFFFIQLLIAVSIEIIIVRKDKPNLKIYRSLFIASGLILIGFIIWVSDVTKLVCDSNNHILNGHSIWHLLTALSFYFCYRFYIKVNKERKL